MTQNEYITRVLVADEGHMLTQSADVTPMERHITDKVYLVVNDSPECWREITDAEAAAYEAEREAAIAAAMEVRTVSDDILDGSASEN